MFGFGKHEEVPYGKFKPNDTVKNNFETTSLMPASIITADVVDACKIWWQSAKSAEDSVEDYIEDILSVEIGLDITPAKRVGDNFFFTSITASADYSDKEFTFTVPDGAPALAISNS